MKISSLPADTWVASLDQGKSNEGQGVEDKFGCRVAFMGLHEEHMQNEHHETISVNDNAPRFLSSNYVASIPEDMPVGTSFMQVTAADPDEGPNAVVDYFFDEADAYVKLDKFRLDRTSGTLRINQPLDREAVDS